MGILGNLFNRSEPRREARDTTNEQLNAILAPLGDRIWAFKDETDMSWVVILPAVQDISIRLSFKHAGVSQRAHF